MLASSYPDPRVAIAAAIAVIIFYASIVNSAWVCDDAYITFRTIDNLVNGFGLRWNISERVQAFTHPLWLFLLTGPHLIFHDIYYVALGVSLLLSGAGVWLVTRYLSDHWIKCLWIGISLAISKAFVEYSTSGLENPLSHVILAAYLLVFLRVKAEYRRTLLFVLAGLAGLNRLDALVIIVPSLAWEVWRIGFRAAVRPLIIGFAPLLLWLAFSTFYFGSPLPNTAYAKLNTGVPHTVLFGLGFDYFVHSVEVDPITLAMVLLALFFAIYTRGETVTPAAGLVLHGLYILWVGGDFMSGRFLTTMYLVSVVLVSVSIGRTHLRMGSVLVGTLILGCLSPSSPVWARWSDSPTRPDPAGVVDERAFYFDQTSLPVVLGNGGRITGERASDGRALRARKPSVTVRSTIGMAGYFAGPHVHIVDLNALADPFLSRLPATPDVELRSGHFSRSIPRGYVESIWKGDNRIQSSALSSYFDVVANVTRADLFSLSRFLDIISTTFGHYDHFLVGVADASATYGSTLTTNRADSLATEADRAALVEVATEYARDDDQIRASAAWSNAQRIGARSDHFWQLGARLAEALHRRDQGRLSMKILEKCVAGRPGILGYHTALAEAYFTQGEFRQAATEAKRGFDFGAPRVKPLRVVADVMRIQRMPEAEGNYRAILEIDPENGHAARELDAIAREGTREPGETQ